MNHKFAHVVVGGTFDLLHQGHKQLLQKAFSLGENVSIGLTTDSFNRERNKITSQDQNIRKKNLVSFLNDNNYADRYSIIWIDDIYGTSTTDTTLEAIVVTEETLPNAMRINDMRNTNGLRELEIIVTPYVTDAKGEVISSSKIREESKGQVRYLKLLLEKSGIQLGEVVREKLKKPFGILTKVEDLMIATQPIITVGDVTTQRVLATGNRPHLSIIDLKVQRKMLYKKISDLGFDEKEKSVRVVNPPGEISRDLIVEIQKVLQKGTSTKVIQVEGEEDLAVIPVVLLSSLGTKVLYGQPNEGLVDIIVDEAIKQKLAKLLSTISK